MPQRLSRACFVAFVVIAGCAASGESSSSDSLPDSNVAGGKSPSTGSDPPACSPVIPKCKAGEELADVDGDGCSRECRATTPKPAKCPTDVPTCKPGEQLADLDGDGCALECQAGSPKPGDCPPVAVSCDPGEEPADPDGDGCFLDCAPMAGDGGGPPF